MSPTSWLEQLGFLLVALLTLGSALGVVLARRVLHAALWLLPTLVGVAAVFALLGAHVLFAMQLVVYVGAITVLIVFAVMLMEQDVPRERLPRFLRYRIPARYVNATNVVMHYYSGMQHVIAGVVAAGFMALVILAAVVEASWFKEWRPLQPEPPSEFAGENARYIGELFLNAYLLPFEVASVVLLVALIGAVVLARRDRPALTEPSPPSPEGRSEGEGGRGGEAP